MKRKGCPKFALAFLISLIAVTCCGQVPGNEAYSREKFRNWISFTGGAGEYAEFTSSTFFRPEPDFTIECWIRLNNNNPVPFQHIFGNCWNPAGGLENNWGMGFALLNNRLGFHVIINGSPTRQYEISNPADTFSVCKWYHIAGVKKGTEASFYVNGELRASQTLPDGNIRSAEGYAHLGTNYASGFSNWFSGNIDELRIWGIARTVDQIRSSISDTLSGNEAGLNAYFKFNESGSGNELELKNSAVSSGNNIKGLIRSPNAESPFLNDSETLPFPSPPVNEFNPLFCLSPGSYEISASSPGIPSVRYYWYSTSGADTILNRAISGPDFTTPFISSSDTFFVSVLNLQNFCQSPKRAIGMSVCRSDDYPLLFPNLLTINGDGKNDAFEISNLERHPPGKLSIYSKWGEKIYQTDHYQNNWKGEEGHYYYIFSNSRELVKNWLFVSGK